MAYDMGTEKKSNKTIEQVISGLKFSSDGLIPAIAQQYNSGEILMMAWMNKEAVKKTLRTGQVCYWSRSRKSLWRKGETSGQIQILKEFRWDCDSDTVLILIDQIGVACHTGRRNCFYNALRDGELIEISKPKVSPFELYEKT